MTRTRRLGPATAAWCALGLAASLGCASASASCTALGAVTCSATVTAAPLPFGNYNPGSGATRDVASVISVTGTAYGVGLLTTLAYTISLSAGNSGSEADRRLVGGTGGPSLAYNLYTNGNYDTVWGNGTVSDSLSAVAVVLGGSAVKNYTVYGRIPASQFVSPGSYSDTITVTVLY